MRSNFSYWFTDFAVKLLTFDSYVFKKLINANLSLEKKGDILDVGCGTGTQAPLFPKSKYLGLDLDKGAIEYAKNLYPGYKFIVGDATSFGLNKKFDSILVVGVLHHLSDVQVKKSLTMIKRHLKSTGTVLIIEAIPPLFKWNLVGKFLRSRDRGAYIRELKDYEKIIGNLFTLNVSRNIFGGFFDYAFFIIHHQPTKKKA